MAPKNDKNKSSSAAPAANSDIIGDLEIGSSENLAKTIHTHLQHLNHTRLGKEEENIKKTNLYFAIKLTLQEVLEG